MVCYFWNVWTVFSSVTPLAWAHIFTIYTHLEPGLPPRLNGSKDTHTHTNTHNVPAWKLVPLTGYQSGNRGEKKEREQDREGGRVARFGLSLTKGQGLPLKAHWHKCTHGHPCMCALTRTHTTVFIKTRSKVEGRQLAAFTERRSKSRQLASFTSVCPLNRDCKKV